MSRVTAASARLVGRADEVNELASLFRQHTSAGAQVRLIEGAPGIGKSALMRAMAAQAESLGFRVIQGRADELDGRRSFSLFSDHSGNAWFDTDGDIGRGRGSLDSAAGALAGRAGGTTDVEFHASEAAIATVERHCSAAPLALIVEDLHWADGASLFVLRRLIRHAASLPLVMLGTLRPLPRPPELLGLLADFGEARRLTLTPLPPAAVNELVHQVVGRAPGPHLRAQAAMAGGNPLFVLELLDALRAEGSLREQPGASIDAPIVEIEYQASPTSLSLVILHRLSFLSADALAILGLAAVFGARFQPSLVAALARRPVTDLLAALREALACGLLIDDGDELSFRHDVVREALYRDLPSAMRSGLHRDAADVLSRAGAPPGARAEHLLRGARRGDAEAIAWLQETGNAMAETSPAIAVELLQRAIDLVGADDPAIPALTADLAVALIWSDRPAEGEALCRRAIAALDDPRHRGWIRERLVELILRRGHAAAALAEATAGLEDPELDAAGRARLQAAAAMARLFVGDAAGARAAGRSLQDDETVTDAGVKTRALVVQALAAEQAGEVIAASVFAKQAVALTEATGSRDAHNTLPYLPDAMSLLDSDRFDDAAAQLARSREAQERFGSRSALPIHHFILGFIRFWSGAWDEAAAEVETGIALGEETGTGWRAAACGLRAAIALGRDERPAATEWLRAGTAALDAGEGPYRSGWLEWTHAMWHEESPPAERAPFFARMLAAPVWPSIVLATTGPTTVRLALEMDHPEHARSVADAIDCLTRQNAGIAGIAAARTMVHGLLKGDAQMLASAADAYAAAGRPLEAALAAEEAAVAAARAGRSTNARRWHADAVAGYGRLRAAGFAARASRRLHRLGIRTRRPAAAPPRPSHGWDSLTPMEQRVLRLIVERRSNPEIAVALGISRRTVETHVSHILNRVDLRSRLELAADAARQFGWRLRLEDVPEDREQT